MKSAYELAMERLRSEESHKELSQEQKEQLKAIDEKFKAKLAERELFLVQKLNEAREEGNYQEAEKIQKEILDEKVLIEEEKEKEKDRIRNA